MSGAPALASGRVSEPSLRLPLAASVLLHVGLVAAFLMLRGAPAPPAPPMYRVNLVAAPPGERAIGVVRPPGETPPAAAAPAPTPVRPKMAPSTMPVPAARTSSAPRAATPVPPTKTRPATSAAAPTAGGGPVGGRGSDVVSVSTGGIQFPDQGYLDNIVRQVALRFHPSARGALRADVYFLIRRDGTVPPESIRLVTRSGVYSFDLEAQGAVEAAATARRFGPLPAGYADDVLPVTFRFAPQGLR